MNFERSRNIGSSSTAIDLKEEDWGSPNCWPSVLWINVESNSSNIIDELWENESKKRVHQS